MKKAFNYNKAITIILVIGLVIIANIASLYLFTRFDFTENRIYSISKPSKKILGDLKDRLTIKAYFSNNMPTPYNSVSQFVRDILEEYKAYGKGNIYFEYINPGDDKKLEEEAMSFRVPPLQVNALENDKIEIKKVYMGLVFLYQDRKEVLPVISKTVGLEYEITSAIKRLIINQKKTVGIIQGHQEPVLKEKLQNLNAILQKQYEVRELNLPQLNSIPADITIGLLIAPQDTFSMEDLYKIDQFIMRGGKMGFFLNEHGADIGRGIAYPLYHKLSPFLEHYGIKLNNDMVMDAQCIPINVQQQQGSFQMVNQIRFPFFPVISNFNKDNIIVKDLERVVHFFPSSLDTSFAGTQGIKVDFLTKSSDKSGSQIGRFDINPLQQYDNASFEKPGFILSAIYSGMFKSYYNDANFPITMDKNQFIRETLNNRILVFGEGNFIQDEYLSSIQENIVLINNSIDWLGQDEDLITIRSREVTARPLKSLESKTARIIIKWGNILIPPILAILAGFLLALIRRKRRDTLIKNLLNV